MPLEELEVVFKGPPALHRFPGSMAKRTQQVCQHLVEHHGGRAEDLWEGAADAQDLFQRLTALPGYGKEKAKIFMALLAKRFGIRPDGLGGGRGAVLRRDSAARSPTSTRPTRSSRCGPGRRR